MSSKVFDKRNIVVMIVALLTMAMLTVFLAGAYLVLAIVFLKQVSFPLVSLAPYFKIIAMILLLFIFVPTLIAGSIIATESKHNVFMVIFATALICTIAYEFTAIFNFLFWIFISSRKFAMVQSLYEQQHQLQLQTFLTRMLGFPFIFIKNFIILSIPHAVNSGWNNKWKVIKLGKFKT